MPDAPRTLRPPAVPVLRDGVVTLRAHRAEDAEAVVEQSRDPESIRWTSVPVPYGLEQARASLEGRPVAWAAGEVFALAIDDGRGYAGTVDLRARPGHVEVGFGLHPRARGRGVMTRALRLMLTWGFEALETDVVQWRASVGNWPSRRAAWAVGFRFAGTVPGLLDARDGGPEDGWVATLRRGDPLVPAHDWFVPPTLRAPVPVVLRAHRPDDAVRLAEGCSDELTRRWLPWLPAPYTEHDAVRRLQEVLEDHARGRAVVWAMADPDSDRLIGEIAVNGLTRTPDHSPEIGYWTHPEGRNRGLTTAAVKLAARHALIPATDGGLGVHRLGLRAAAGNRPSQAVARRAGFRHCGTEHEALTLLDGGHADQECFELLAHQIGPDGERLDHTAPGEDS